LKKTINKQDKIKTIPELESPTRRNKFLLLPGIKKIPIKVINKIENIEVININNNCNILI
jgi:hypothetical protein